MKYLIRLMLVIVALVCGLPSSGIADDPTGLNGALFNGRLNGHYAETFNGVCLNAPGGFDASNQPLNTADSSISAYGGVGIFYFDGAGKGSVDQIDNSANYATNPTASTFLPSVATVVGTGGFTYSIEAGGVVTITSRNETITYQTGPDAGTTATIDKIVTSGNLTPDNKTLTLGSTDTAIETITHSTGSSNPRICARGDILVKTD